MTVNLNKQKSILTTVPEANLEKLTDIDEMIICDSLEDTLLAKEDTLEVDVGYGILFIKYVDGSLKFKFKPNAKFERELVETIVEKKNNLKVSLERSLATKLIQTYKDLM